MNVRQATARVAIVFAAAWVAFPTASAASGARVRGDLGSSSPIAQAVGHQSTALANTSDSTSAGSGGGFEGSDETSTIPAEPSRKAQEGSAPRAGANNTKAPVLDVLTLDDALHLAMEHNPDLAASRARLEQSKTLGAKAWSGYLPQLNVGGSYTYNSTTAEMMMPTGFGLPIPDGGFDPSALPPGGGFIPVVPIDFITLEIQKEHMFQGNVQLSQNLFAPALIPLIQNASRALEAAKLGHEATRREILFATAQLYYAAASMKEVEAVQRRQLEVTKRHEEDARLQVQQGMAARVVQLRAQIELASAQQELRRAQLAYESSKSALAALLGRDPDFEVVRPPPPTPPDELSEDEDELLNLAQYRPDLLAQRKNVEITRGNRTAVLTRYLPNLALFGQYSLSNTAGFTGEHGMWTAGVQLSWNIFDGGLREAELREAAAQIAESQATVTAAEARARDEVRRALLDLASARANRIRASEQMKLADETASLVRTGFEAGASSYLEVLDANAALTGAELAFVSESLNADLAVLALARAAGLFDPLEPHVGGTGSTPRREPHSDASNLQSSAPGVASSGGNDPTP